MNFQGLLRSSASEIPEIKITTQGTTAILLLQIFSGISFSMVFSLLTLYLLANFHKPLATIYDLVAAYNALGYATSIFGGYLAERYLGYRFAIVFSLLLGLVGMCVLAIPKTLTLHLGLACLTLSYGILIPAVFVLLSDLHKNSARVTRDNNFVLAYIGMDMGAFIAAISSGYLSIYISYSFAFLIGAVFLLITLGLFIRYRKFFSTNLYYPQKTQQTRVTGIVFTAAALPVLWMLLDYASLCNSIMIVLGISSIGLILYYRAKQHNSYRGKLLVFVVLLVISTIYDTSYFLTPSALTVFTNSNIDRHISGSLIPTTVYSALNPLFIITIGPLLNLVWRYLDKMGKRPSLPNRFAVGITLMGCGYLILMLGTGHSNTNSLISPWWLVGGLLLQTTGELFISPAGYSMVGLLVPITLEGSMMGISQFSSGVASALSSYLSTWVSPPDLNTSLSSSNLWYQHAFLSLALSAFLIAAILLYFSKTLNKLANATDYVEEPSRSGGCLSQTSCQQQEVINQ